MAPLKSAELHRLARDELGPRLGQLGVSRTPRTAVASWYRQEKEGWLVLWFQPSRSNDSTSAGFRFTVEVLLGPEPVIYGRGYRKRLPTLLDDGGRESLRQLENRAIAKLPPPNMVFAKSLPTEVREHFLAGWKPRTTPYAATEDVWLLQGDKDDARALMSFIDREFPLVIERFLISAAQAGWG